MPGYLVWPTAIALAIGAAGVVAVVFGFVRPGLRTGSRMLFVAFGCVAAVYGGVYGGWLLLGWLYFSYCQPRYNCL